MTTAEDKRRYKRIPAGLIAHFRRFGGGQDAEIPGVIQNVGLRGVFFAALELPEVDARGTLWGPGGRPIDVQVTWRSLGSIRGVGLRFDAPPPS